MTLNHHIVNTQTGEEIIEPFTNDEIDAYQATQAALAQELIDQATKATTRQAVLDKLGISADEVAALLG